MWRSFGDKYDISKHDDIKYKRKVRTSTLATILLFVNAFSASVMNGFNIDRDIRYEIAMWIAIASAILTTILTLIKYLVNNREIDMSLPIYTSILFVISILYANFEIL